MKELVSTIEFWVAMLLAILLKLSASNTITAPSAAVSIAIAVAAALVFTEPTLKLLELNGEIFTSAVAALLALTFEHIARQLLSVGIRELLQLWRGNR